MAPRALATIARRRWRGWREGRVHQEQVRVWHGLWQPITHVAQVGLRALPE